MNKNLIALAVAGACVAPAAAMAQTGPVTLYGRVYELFSSVEAKGDGPAAETPRRTVLYDESSLLGVRGTEDLTGGLKAFFQLETAFNATQTSGNTFANRNSGIGLQGGWGSILIGRWDMPYKVTTYSVDAFGDLTLGGIVGVGHGQGTFDRRDSNVVQYWSPNFAGFGVKVAMTTNETKTATVNPHDEGANITYAHGPVYAFLAYEKHKDVAVSVDEKAYSGGGTFAFGPLKVGAEYEKNQRDGHSDRKSWLGSLVYSLGKNQFIYQYQHGKDGAVNDTDEPSCNSNTVAYKYVFTKRTFFIAQYTQVDNNAAATCNLGYDRVTLVPGADPRGAAIGLQHIF